MDIKLKWLTWLQLGLIGIVLLYVCVAAWDRWYPYNPVTFHKVEVLNADHAVPGGMLWIKIFYDKYMDVVAASNKVLVCGGRKISLGADSGPNPVGMDQIGIIPVIIPTLSSMEWDNIKIEMRGEAFCFVRGVYRYTLPSGREIQRKWETEPFPVR